MDLPATQAMDDEDFVPTQKVTEDKELEKSLIGTLIVKDNLQHQIFSGTTIIGRLSDCTIVLNDETVSKRHAEIEAESTNRAIFIKDLGSSNKTKINDTKLRPNASYQIRDNDKLNFGKVTAIFKIHQPIEDSFVACTPQVNKKTVIPDTPDSSMNNSSVLKDNVSTIPETQADEDDSCFRHPQIRVRTSINNEHKSPKHVPFTLDDIPSPLSNSNDNDISGVETQRFTVNNTKAMTDNSIYMAETQKFVVPEKSSVHSHNNEDCRRTLNNSSVKRALSEKLENQSLEDIETQEFVQINSNSSFRPQNTSLSIENAETQPFIPIKSSVEESNLADVSIHSAATQKIEKSIEDLETQPFTHSSFGSDKRKSANASIYSAETQKVIADVSNQSLNDIQMPKFKISNSDSKIKSADVSIYSAATQKITPENVDIEDLETQKCESTRSLLSNDSHQIIKEDKMASNLSVSIQDIDTVSFKKHELSLDMKSNADMQDKDDNLLDSAAARTTKYSIDKEVDHENSKSIERISTKSDEPHTVNEINENIQNQRQDNEALSKSVTKSLQSSTTFEKSKSLVGSDNEEEIFSQNLIENCPFRLLLDDSKNDTNEQLAADLQNNREVETDKTVDSEHNIPLNNEDNNANNENLTRNKSGIVENDDSETDEEGVFSSNSFRGKENEKSHKETGNDSETDEEGVFSNHITEEGEKSKSKPEGDSETDEEGVFSGHLSKDSNGKKSSNNNKIINESESEDEGIFSNNQLKNKSSKDYVDPDESVTKAVGDSSVDKSTKKVVPPSPKMERSLVNEMVQAESPIPESDDDIFNENDEEKRTSYSGSDKLIDKNNADPIINSSKSDTVHSEVGKNDTDIKDVDELAPTQIVETEDLSLAPTQILNRASNWEEDRSDELAPTQLIESQNLQNQAYNLKEKRSEEVDDLAPTQLIENLPYNTATALDSVSEVAQEHNDMDVAPTQKLVETQHCAESLAPTQKVDTQIYSEEMGTLQFSESLAPTQIIESEPNDIVKEIVTKPKNSLNTSKRQPEEAEIKSNKKLKTLDGSPKSNVDLNSTIEQNLNEMFEGSEENSANIEVPIETQQLENILESSQIEESSATALDVSVSKPSPTLSSKRSSIRGKSRRRPLTLKKSSALNDTPKSVANLNDTIEQNLNELFDNNGENVETPEPEPMLTQQLESVLDSQDSNSRGSPVTSKKEEGRTLNVSRRKSLLSLSSMSLNNSMAKLQNDKEKYSSKNVQSISKKSETTSVRSLNEKSPQNEDYSANLEKDNAISENITSENDKVIVYRRGTIGFTETLEPVSTFDRVAFLDKYSTSDSQSDGDDIFKLRQSPRTPSGKKRVSLRLKSVDSNSSMTSSASDKEMNTKTELLPTTSPMEYDKNSDSGDDLLKGLPVVKIAGTVKNPVTSVQLAMPSDHDTDTESIKSVKIELPDRWKCYAEKCFDPIYDKYKKSKKKADDSESENDEDKEIETKNVTNESVKDREKQCADINKILAEVEKGKSEQKRKSSDAQNGTHNENVIITRSRKVRKSKTPSPKPAEDSDADSDKTNPVLSSSSDSESSEHLSILPTYRPVSPFKIDTAMLVRKQQDEEDSEEEFQPMRISCMFNREKASPRNVHRRRKSACNNNTKDLTQCDNNADNEKLGAPIIGTVNKGSRVFQVSRDSKATSTTTTSRTSASATTNRTKRIIDDGDDDKSTHQPSPKRTKTLANRQKLQQVTVVISPLKDKLKKLREGNQLNVANTSSNFKQPDSTCAQKMSTRAPKTLDNYVVVSKTATTDSSDMSAVENSIVEDKTKSKNKSKIKGKPVARNRKAKVDTSSERNANSSTENLGKFDVQKPETRGRGRRNQATDSSVSDKESSMDERSANDVENKSTRITRSRLVRKNHTKEEEKTTIKDSRVIQESHSEESQEFENTVRKNTKSRSIKTIDKSNSSKIDAVAESKNDTIPDKKDTKSQSSSQSESVTARTTRTRKNKINQEETSEVTATIGSKRKPANNKFDSSKLKKKTMNVKPEEASAHSATKTRTRAVKNATVVEASSSEGSDEAFEIMKNSVLEESKTTRRRERVIKNHSSYVRNTESSDDEKLTSRPKRARLTKADKNKSSHVSDTNEDSTQSSQKSTRRKHSPSPNLTSPSDAALTPLRSSRLSLSPTKKPKVLFTGEKSDAHRKILRKLGGVETEEFDKCSVLITDKVRRTFKFLCSLARGIPIASEKWLNESNKANHFLDLEKFILNDPEAEAKFKFNLKESLDKARKHKLLEGYTIVLSPKIKQPPIIELKEMVISSGGKPLLRAPAKWPEKSIVVTIQEESDSAKKLIAKAPKSVTVQSIEFILTGILRQDINLNEFKILS